MSVYGPFKTPLDVEATIRSRLQTWLNTYLGEIERRSGGAYELGSLPRPERWYVATDVEDILDWPDRDLPAVIVESTGEADVQAGSDRLLDEWMHFTVTVIYRGTGKREDREHTRAVVVLLAAAIKWVLWQHRRLDGIAAGLDILSTNYDIAAPAKPRTLSGAEIEISVLIPGVVQLGAGPDTPDDPLPEESPGNQPVVTSTSVTLVAEHPE